MDEKTLVIDMSRPEEAAQLLPQAPVLSSQSIGWKGLLFQEFHHPAHEIPEYCMPHHMILIAHTQSLRQENRLSGKLHSGIRSKGDILLVPAHVTNATRWFKEAKFSILTLCPQFVQEVSHESANLYEVDLVPKFSITDPLIHQIGLALKADIEAGYPTGRLFGDSAATMLAARLLQQHSIRSPKRFNSSGGLSRYTLKQTLDYIQAHLKEDIKITDLAKVAGMSPYYFICLFKQSMNITPHQYIIQQRIEQAKQLLKNRNLTIVETAFQCGFTSQSHLTNVFRKLTGTTPKAYRKH